MAKFAITFQLKLSYAVRAADEFQYEITDSPRLPISLKKSSITLAKDCSPLILN